MEAAPQSRLRSAIAPCALICIFILALASNANAANHRTRNFIIQAPTAKLAVAVGTAAEKYRSDLATYWLGSPLPPWPSPCPIRVVAGNLAAQGVTTYNLQPVRDFQMEVIGTPQRILDSVLPHEITHTILASHFGRPLPRWADEGICTTVEHVSERSKHEDKLREFLASRRGIAMNQLFLMKEYPSDVLPMYAQGYSVCRFLIEQKSPRDFIDFLSDYMRRPSWTQNVRKHYGYNSLAELQEYWLAWVTAGSGPVDRYAKVDRPSAMRNPGGRENVIPVSATIDSRSASRAAPAVAFAHGNSRRNSSGNSSGKSIATDSGQWLPMETPVRQTRSSPETLAHADGRQVGGALSASADAGWYTRQREQAETLAATQTGSVGGQSDQLAPHVVSAIAPPSVRDSGRYSVSQPQPERRISRTNLPSYPIYDAKAVRRFR